MSFQKYRTSHPWEKPKGELTQFDWLTAVGLSGPHRTKPTELRVAQEFARFASHETNIAWPTMETIAQYVGVHRVNASKAVKSLQISGAVLVTPIAHLPDEYRADIKRRGRGNAYCLNIQWAFDILSLKPMMHAPEPPGLKNARLNKATNVTDTTTLPQVPNVTTPVTSNVTIPVTLQCNGRRYTNIKGDIERNRIAAGKKEMLVSMLPTTPTSKQVDNVVRHAMRGLHAFRDRSTA